jgi:hypothetical protein
MEKFPFQKIDRDEAVVRIRRALAVRSKKEWSVTQGRNASSTTIAISSPPRRKYDRAMSAADRAELGRLLGLTQVHPERVLVFYEKRAEYVARAEGRLSC